MILRVVTTCDSLNRTRRDMCIRIQAGRSGIFKSAIREEVLKTLTASSLTGGAASIAKGAVVAEKYSVSPRILNISLTLFPPFCVEDIDHHVTFTSTCKWRGSRATALTSSDSSPHTSTIFDLRVVNNSISVP
jgi:hypothetical protein